MYMKIVYIYLIKNEFNMKKCCYLDNIVCISICKYFNEYF